MRLQEIMSKQVKTAAPDETAEAAWQRMKLAAIHHLVVLEDRAVVGVLSARDLGGERGGALRRDATVADLMSSGVITATPQTQVRAAANRLRGRGIGCLPVLDGKRVVGIVTTADLLELLGRGAERPIEESVRWTLRKRGPRKGRTGGRPTA